MANLVNLQEFDREFRQTTTNLNNFHNSINRGVLQKIWSRQQRDDLVQLQYSVTSLLNAIERLVSNNRDGRG
jgi:hypothetical protein